MFGMNIRVYGREVTKKPSHSQPDSHKNAIPFPSSNDEPLQIRPAGEQSRIREQFMFLDAAGRVRPRSVSAGQHISSPTRAVSPGNVSTADAPAPSPTYFYTSPANDSPTTENAQTPYHNATHSLDPAAQRLSSDANNQERYRIARRPIVGLRESRDATTDAHVQCYTSQRDCYYCPSRGPVPGATHPTYFTSCATSPPSAYYPISHPSQTMQPPSPMIVAAPSGSGRYVYDYEPAHSPQMVNVLAPNWNFEHAMLSGNNNMSLVPHPRVPYWLPENQGLIPPVGAYYPQLSPSPDIQHVFYPHMNDIQIPRQFDPSAQPQIYVSNHHDQPALSAGEDSPPLPSHGPSVNSIPMSNVAPERNQLNLARIEDGQDTRTTVMIKNIPNKMSDRDLVLYIGKVCPRKIDFLYLRMDFQNGKPKARKFLDYCLILLLRL